MKIVACIRQLLSAKETATGPVVEDVPLPVEATPEHNTFRRAVERPAATQSSPLALVPPKKTSLRLEGEGIEHPIADPPSDIIRRELERLRSSGPSHLALIAPDGSYLQAAGNAKRMTVESHIAGAQTTTHVVLGRQGSPGPDATIILTAGSIEVRASEVWTAPEAVNLFNAFAETGSVAAALSRRDITASISKPNSPQGSRNPFRDP